MRNLKKVLTLVLTVAMVLSIMVVGTGAAFSDQDQIKNKEAVDVCTTLNIIAGMEDGSYRPTNNVTRAQMCKMICVALNGGKEPVLGTNANPTFSDVRTDPSSSWAESFIESCNSQGIVSGVGGGRFNPSGSVTGTQAARMLLVALGYRADLAGFTGESWAINVNTAASAKGLYKGLESIDANAALSRDNAAQMIWNALNAYEVEYVSQLITDKDGKLTSTLVPQDKVVGTNRDKITLLEDKYEAETAIGTFAGNSKMISALKSGNIRIEGVTINGAAITGVCDFTSDLDLKYIGEEVKVLYRDSIDGRDGRLDEKDTVYGVYVTGATTVYNIVKDDIQKVTTDKIKFGDVEHEYVRDAANAIVKNYGAMASETMNAGNLNALAVASGDTIKFIENENGKIERAYVVESHISKVSAVNATKITIPGIGGAININDNDNDIYSSPAKDDVVVYTQLYKANKDDATFIVTKAETVSGTMKSYKDLEKVSIDGTNYFIDVTELERNTVGGVTTTTMKDLTDDAITAFNNGHLEESATLYLINGFVGAADSQATNFEYALVTAADNMSKVGNAISGAKVQLLTMDGKAIYDVDEDTSDNFGTVAKPNSLLTDLEDNPAIVKYTKVSDTSVEIKDVITTKATHTTIYDKDTKQLTVQNDGTKMVVASDAVFFTSTSASGDYKAYNLRSLGNISASPACDVYYATNDDNDAVVVAFADLKGKPTGASSDTKYGMVTSVERNVKVDGTNYNKYVVWAGEEVTIYVKPAPQTDFEKGTYIYFDKTSDDTYGENDVHVLTSANAVLTVKYEEGDKLLTYKTAANSGNVTKAVVDDLKITYVNRADKTAGDDIGINKYDEVNGYANAMIIVDSDGKIEGIIVDVNDDILNAGEVATVNVSVAAAGPFSVSSGNVTIAAQPNAEYAANDKVSIVANSTATFVDGSTYTLTVNGNPITAVGTGASTLTFQYLVTSTDVSTGTDITLSATALSVTP